MRGTPLRPIRRRFFSGIIPAYAGNTMACRPFLRSIRDHPRVCGEHRQGPVRRRSEAGSSPRMRGTPFSFGDRTPHDGIIPAYAGNTCLGHTSSTSGGDHPRVCGEHWMPVAASCAVVGSSPRMRGTPTGAGGLGRFDRIIPAYAGNTTTRPTTSCTARDHPRVCGEHACSHRKKPTSVGSSPRMRGTH